MIISAATLILVFLYVLFLFFCHFQWLKIKNKSDVVLDKKMIHVAVVIAVRNEILNLPELINAISKQDYPHEKFRVMIVDDHSDDDTFHSAEYIIQSKGLDNFICLRSPGHSKKAAIQFAIENCEAELIITTDADVTMGREWISSIVNEYVISNSLMICAPVRLTGEKKFLQRLQSVEFAGLIGIGAAGINARLPMICNGANLAFSKRAFIDVKGYVNSKSFSGDDTQLMLKIHKRFPGGVSYLKDSRAIISTGVLPDTNELWQQRKRWASKIPGTLSLFTIVISVLAWLVHALLLMQIFNVILNESYLLLFLPWSMKVMSEILFLKSIENFFHDRTPVWIIICAQPFYCLYIVIVGLLAPLSGFKWKDRKLQ